MIKRAWPLAGPGGWFSLGLVMVAVYAVLRTLGVAEVVVLAWTAFAAVVTIASPVAGLTMLAALGPFTEAQTADGRVTVVPYLLAATGASLVVHVLVTRALPRLSVPLVLALLLFVGTAAGVLVSAASYGTARGIDALQMWVPGLGGALTVLLAAVWVGWRGEVRPIYVAVAAISVGAALSLVNALANDLVLNSALGWLLRPDIDPTRLGGLLPVPNTAAAMFIVGIVVALAIALDSTSRSVRVLALAGVAVQTIALLLTYSRSGYLALGVGVLLVLARRWPRQMGRIAIVILLIGLPVFTWLWLFRDVPPAADQYRLTAWSAALRMWLDHPILGAGFRSFEWLHLEYGSPLLNAPHNEWLRLFAEEGTLVGIVGAAFAISTPIVLLRSSNMLVGGIGAAAAALFLSAFFNNPFINSQLNVPAFLIVGMGLGICARAPAAVGRSATLLADDDGDGSEQDLEVHPQRPPVDVVEV